MKKITLFFLVVGCFSFMLIPPKKGTFTLKKFEKNLAQIKPDLYAGKYEVTNLEYNEFLHSIKKEGNKELIEKVKIFNENWDMDNAYLGPIKEHYHVHPAYHEYPVVNISHEGAVAFCEWLTESYNSFPKREFNKVKFRLPTENEWIYAASGGHEKAIFPWGGYYVRNAQGQFLANFRRLPQTALMKMKGDNLIEIKKDDTFAPHTWSSDNALLLAPSESYVANDYGLYNCSGNAAEMLAEPGQTKGGSWNSFGYYIRIDAEDEYAGFMEPSPQIGFRYFMEVIEE